MGGAAVSNWFQNKRIEWIKESVEIFGAIRREHIQRKFGVSVPQASVDLGYVMAMWPRFMVYNKSTKQYERAK